MDATKNAAVGYGIPRDYEDALATGCLRGILSFIVMVSAFVLVHVLASCGSHKAVMNEEVKDTVNQEITAETVVRRDTVMKMASDYAVTQTVTESTHDDNYTETVTETLTETTDSNGVTQRVMNRTTHREGRVEDASTDKRMEYNQSALLNVYLSQLDSAYQHLIDTRSKSNVTHNKQETKVNERNRYGLRVPSACDIVFFIVMCIALCVAYRVYSYFNGSNRIW